MTLFNWKIYKLPLDWKFVYDLRSSGRTVNKPGVYFKGNFSLIEPGDTYSMYRTIRKVLFGSMAITLAVTGTSDHKKGSMPGIIHKAWLE